MKNIIIKRRQLKMLTCNPPRLEAYKCPECGNEISNGDLKCKGCNSKIEWHES